MNKITTLALALSLSSTPLYATSDLDDALSGFDESASTTQPTSDLDDALGGFDESTKEQGVDAGSMFNDVEESPISISGSLGFLSSYNYAHSAPATDKTDYRGFSKLKFSSNVLADIKLNDNWKAKVELKAFYDPIYEINDRSNYSTDTITTYESEFELNEAFIEGSLTNEVDLKVGRQIVVWGKSDSIRITDVINPLNNREPGMVDIEDLRLPVLMSKLSYYSGDWSYNVFAIHEQRNPKESAIGSEFLPKPQSFPDVDEGTIDLGESTFAYSIDGRFSGWDLSFYTGTVTDSRWHFEDKAKTRVYGLVDMTGIATNIVVSGFLLKAEMAYLDNLDYNTTTKKKSRIDRLPRIDRLSRIDSLVGIEYMGITDWVLSAEYANRSIQDYEAKMKQSPDVVQENTAQLALRASYSFDHDNATVSLLNSAFGDGGEQGGFYRLWLDYAVNDQVQISTGLIDYQTGTSLIWKAISDNDRLFFDAKYSF